MKKLLGILVLGLLLSGCGEPSTKIYPEDGLFPKSKTHDLYCDIYYGKNQEKVSYALNIGHEFAIMKTIKSGDERWILTKDIIQNDEEHFIFTLQENLYYEKDPVSGGDISYILDRKTGQFGIGIGEEGVCVHLNCEWEQNKETNTINYVCDK